jgi:hypothetical protein
MHVGIADTAVHGKQILLPCTNVAGRRAVLFQSTMEKIMANQTSLTLVATVAGLFVETVKSDLRAASIGGKLSASMTALFAECDTDAAFAEVFGNGVNGKAHIPGLLRDAVEAKIVKLSKEKKEAVRNMMRVRFSEARKLRRAEGMPQKGESIQSALKRYVKPAEKQARPGGNAKGMFEIPEELTHDQLADALSLWLSAQTPAKAKALADDLRDMFNMSPAKKGKVKVA